MPIYAYRCGACGHAKDVLQKLSDAPLSVCPACGAESFSKQVTAAGFQLKGSGWYATDFRGGSTAAAATSAAAPAAGADGSSGSGSGGTPAASSGSPASSDSSSGSSASSSGTACGGSCACH
ncbi:FmdB family zinc ribbon protein [Mitsuaria sp. 7]|uniref:FmdB family zinc ribbon protein n=1 Tax=Mitsuaria sp. 7 TaxID=1658665 RepID=UPI0007DD9CB2|nr:FmdB family zinc ribbon protein [Mitsuaria sp. 7]ANH70980.1 FmdB family transcriptional regulator [Mitsuaria sp. 7]